MAMSNISNPSSPPKALESVHLRILVVEDEVMLVFMLEEILTALGYDIAGTASNLKEAGDQIEHTSFDAAILDVNLVGQSTFDLADQLQKKNIPFIFSTAYSLDTLPLKYQNYPVLQKPYTMAQLGSRLETLLPKAS
jgi:DNA-binding response OmpR family regulator